MVLLIDDDKYGQMSANYDTDILKLIGSYPDNVIQYLKDFTYEDLDLTKYQLLMIHDSYPDIEAKNQLILDCKGLKKDLIVFSNGKTVTEWKVKEPYQYIELKKDRLYSNLELFLDDYEEGNYQITTLIDGTDYEKNKAIIIRERLALSLLIKKGIAGPSNIIDENSDEDKDIKELLYILNGKENWEKHYNQIMEDSAMGYGELMEYIEECVNQIKNRS
jgi:hypothetical protein